MAKSEITKKLIKKRNIFAILDTIAWVGVGMFSAIMTFLMLDAKDKSGMPIISADFKALIVSVGITAIIGIVAAIVIKDKIRTAVWMLSLIMLTVIYKDLGMYCTLGAWFIDEYVIHSLYVHYRDRVKINKEIDLRTE